MASGFTHEKRKTYLNCFICSHRFQDPRTLDCLHSFCRKCLQRQFQGTGQTTLSCPFCKKETALEDVANLPNNFTLGAVLEEEKVAEQLQEVNRSNIKCEACSEGYQGVCICTDCEIFLCRDCQKAHGRLNPFRPHTIYTLDQFQSREVVYRSKLREYVPECKKHPDQRISISCNTCALLVCNSCSVQEHKTHSITRLPEALDHCKQEVADLAIAVGKHIAKFENATEEAIRSDENLKRECDITFKKISAEAEEKVAGIRAEELKLKQELEEVYKARHKLFKTAQSTNGSRLSRARVKLEEVNRFMNHASCYEILDLKQKLLKNLVELTKERIPERVPTMLSHLNFEEGDHRMALGKLVLKDEWDSGYEFMQPAMKAPKRPVEIKKTEQKWYLKAKLTTFGTKETKFRNAFDVVAFSDYKIVVVDVGLKQLITFSLSSIHQSYAKPQALHIKGLNDPSCVSVNKDNQLIVVDKSIIKIFNQKHQQLLKFKPDSGTGSSSTPTCLAVDDSNMIAVGHKETEQISLHQPDGSHIRTISAQGIGSHLTISKQQLIYTERARKKLHSIDFNGSKVFSEDIASDMFGIWGPGGLCCDRDGNIYVAVDSMSSLSSEIHEFSPEGSYKGYVIEECECPILSGIILTQSDDNLVVAAKSYIAIFHRP